MVDNVETSEIDDILELLNNSQMRLQAKYPALISQTEDLIKNWKEHKLMDQFCREKPEFLYILVEFKHIQSRTPIVKIGKTVRSVVDRFKEYPKGSILLGSGHVQNCTMGEKLLIDEFNKLYKRRTDVGLEYFQGSILDMESTFHEMIFKIKKIEQILNTKMVSNISLEQRP